MTVRIISLAHQVMGTLKLSAGTTMGDLEYLRRLGALRIELVTP